MIFANLIVSEFRKLATLPAIYIGLAIMVFGSTALTAYNATYVQQALLAGTPDAVGFSAPIEAVMSTVPLGTAGAIIIGVIAMSSEYATDQNNPTSSRQIVTTLTATPKRIFVMLAKLVTVSVIVMVGATVAFPLALFIANHIIGTAPISGAPVELSRMVGAGVYWLFIAWAGFAIATISRSGAIPILILIINSALVSVSFLLLRVTPLAFFLPDAAGVALYARETWGFYDEMLAAYGLVGDAGRAFAPVVAGLIMGAWIIALLTVAVIKFKRSDA